MTDKYEEHNRRVLDSMHPFANSPTVINERMFDLMEANGMDFELQYCVVSRPLKALVHYPGDNQSFRVKHGYLGRFGGYKKRR